MLSLSALAAFLQIVFIDVSLAGDNAIAVGMAAAGLPQDKRRKAVIAGIIVATVLRFIFAIFAVQLMRFTGLLVAGGLILLWVCWKMLRDIRHMRRMKVVKKENASENVTPPLKTFAAALMQIVLADVTMSLDNVLAVAGVARDHLGILFAGLSLSVLLMGAAATLVARFTTRYPWIAYLGLAIVFFTSLHMMWDGARQLISG